ncbi:MAG: hypothetical protein ACR2F2_01815 [Pyrinomonadaceae bacterium]
MNFNTTFIWKSAFALAEPVPLTLANLITNMFLQKSFYAKFSANEVGDSIKPRASARGM